MKKLVLSGVILLSFITQILFAQAVWPEATIVRKQEFIEWDNYSAKTPGGDIIVLWNCGPYAEQGLYINKINAQGESVWEDGILISGSPNVKTNPSLVSAGDGDFFICWWEGQNPTFNLFVTKIDADGQFLWQPQTVTAFTGNISFQEIQHDNSGGLYLVFGKEIPGYNLDLYCQHLSADGMALLPAGGVELTHDTLQEDVEILRLASDNSLIIGYHMHQNGLLLSRLQRMLPTHELAWAAPIILGSSSMVSVLESIVTTDSTQFIIGWTGKTVQNAVLCSYMNKIDLDGNQLFTMPIQIDNTQSASMHTVLSISQSGDIFAMTHKGSNIPPMSNSIKKYNNNGVPLWSTPIGLPDSLFLIYPPVPDAEGGCYILQMFLEDYGLNNCHFTLQHLDNSGQLQWENNGISIAEHVPHDDQWSMSMVFTDRFTFIWAGQYQGKHGLYYQSRDLNGQLTTLPRLVLREGMAGKAALGGTIARTNDVLVYWNDSRFYTSAPLYCRTYFQIVNPDGTTQLPADGGLLVDHVSSYAQKYQALSLADGSIVFLWTKLDNAIYHIMGQAVDNAGNVLWEMEGRILMTFPANNVVSEPLAFADGNDIYITWQSTTAALSRTFVQKLSSDQLMWGAAGLLISSNRTDLGSFEIPVSFKDRYLVIKGTLTNPAREFIWATHLEPDGSITSQWLPDGVLVASFSFTSSQSAPTMLISTALLNGNLVIAGRQLNGPVFTYAYSELQPDATLLIAQQQLLPDTQKESYLCFDNTDDLAFCLKRFPSGSPMTFGYSKLSSNGIYPWGNTIHTVYSTTYSSSLFPELTSFGNGGYCMYWATDDKKVLGGFINSTGEFTTPFGGEVFFAESNALPKTARLSNALYFAWEDFSVAFNYTTGSEIRMQKYTNPTVIVQDETTPDLSNKLLCYPNPFVNDLNLHFTNAQKGKATLTVYDIKGQKVKTIISGILEKGIQTFNWKGRNDSDRPVASGIYYLKLENGKETVTQKVVYIK